MTKLIFAAAILATAVLLAPISYSRPSNITFGDIRTVAKTSIPSSTKQNRTWFVENVD